MINSATYNTKTCMYATVEPRFNEPLFNEVVDKTNDMLRPCQSYSTMYGIEPRYNEPRYTNIIRKPNCKIYFDITNYNVSTLNIQHGRQTLNRSTVSKSFNSYGKDQETETLQSTAHMS